MSTHPIRRREPAHSDLHPLVYKTMIALTGWLVLSIWLLFDRGRYVGLNLVVITTFFLVLVGIPVMLWLSWRREAPDEQPAQVDRYPDWIAHAFSTWTGDISGREAAMQILLPLAAVSIGMTIFGLVFAFTVPHLG